jgi:hypothetical protein
MVVSPPKVNRAVELIIDSYDVEKFFDFWQFNKPSYNCISKLLEVVTTCYNYKRVDTSALFFFLQETQEHSM